MARLPRLVGRGRALEVLLVADDIDGPTAERFGYVNRLLPDSQLDASVEAIAKRIACFDHDTLARTKAYVDQVTLPDPSELTSPVTDFRELFTREQQQAVWKRLETLGLNVDSDFERNLGGRLLEALSDR